MSNSSSKQNQFPWETNDISALEVFGFESDHLHLTINNRSATPTTKNTTEKITTPIEKNVHCSNKFPPLELKPATPSSTCSASLSSFPLVLTKTVKSRSKNKRQRKGAILKSNPQEDDIESLNGDNEKEDKDEHRKTGGKGRGRSDFNYDKSNGSNQKSESEIQPSQNNKIIKGITPVTPASLNGNDKIKSDSIGFHNIIYSNNETSHDNNANLLNEFDTRNLSCGIEKPSPNGSVENKAAISSVEESVNTSIRTDPTIIEKNSENNKDISSRSFTSFTRVLRSDDDPRTSVSNTSLVVNQESFFKKTTGTLTTSAISLNTEKNTETTQKISTRDVVDVESCSRFANNSTYGHSKTKTSLLTSSNISSSESLQVNSSSNKNRFGYPNPDTGSDYNSHFAPPPDYLVRAVQNVVRAGSVHSATSFTNTSNLKGGCSTRGLNSRVSSVYSSQQKNTLRDLIPSAKSTRSQTPQSTTGAPQLSSITIQGDTFKKTTSQNGNNNISIPNVRGEPLIEESDNAENAGVGPEPNQIIAAFSYKSKHLACCYFCSSSSTLSLMNDSDVSLQGCSDLISILLFQIQPTVILLPARIEEEIVKSFMETGSYTPPRPIFLPSTAFSTNAGRNRLLTLPLGNSTQENEVFEDPREKWLRLCGTINPKSDHGIGCAGAVVGYLAGTGAEVEEDSWSGTHSVIKKIEGFSLDGFMHLNPDVLASLQIFQDEAHPSMHSSRSKEGLSIWGLLNNTVTISGRTLLRSWFLRPSLSLDTIKDRHANIAYFLRPEHHDLMNGIRSCLKNCGSIERALNGLKLRAGIRDWQCIMRFTYFLLKIRSLLNGHDNCHIAFEFNRSFRVQDIKDLGALINDVIDFDESVIQDRVTVKTNIDENLDNQKRLYAGLNDLLSQVAREIAPSIPPEFANSFNVIYFPQLGYLITIPLRSEMRNKEDFELEGMVFQFATANTVAYKNDRMRELDEYLGDIHEIIVDREIEIVQRLQEAILTHVPTILSLIETLSRLDCILSLAFAAKKYNYVAPVMMQSPGLTIKGGRHPLQELCVDTFIPNDVDIGTMSRSERVHIVSGGNGSGKSVWMKMVAIITFMSHIGSFVPAQNARIGLVDKILTRIMTRESATSMQSAFMIDIQQVSLAMRQATPRSIIAIDEFGKGTESTDGVGLLYGVLKHFLRCGKECPMLLVATHFYELFSENLLKPTLPIHYSYMDLIVDESGTEKEVTFLYR